MAFNDLIGRHFNSFVLEENIGRGAFGTVFSARHIYSRKLFAAKVEERVDGRFSYISKEFHLYQVLHSGGRMYGIPQVFHYEEQDTFCLMIMEKLGGPVDRDEDGQEITLPIERVLNIAVSGLRILEKIHGMGIIHSDLKPSNILRSLPGSWGDFQIADFGLAEFYLEGANCHNQMEMDKNIQGTIRYSSTHTHDHIIRSRRDDLEMFGYVLVKLFKGRLPWDEMVDNMNRVSNLEMTLDREWYANAVSNVGKQTGDMKKNIKPQELCKEMPEAFTKYMEYVKKMTFKEKPYYNYLTELFTDAAEELGFDSYSFTPKKEVAEDSETTEKTPQQE